MFDPKGAERGERRGGGGREITVARHRVVGLEGGGATCVSNGSMILVCSLAVTETVEVC